MRKDKTPAQDGQLNGQSPNGHAPLDPQDIYRQLKKGLGHEHVTDANVFALIELAEQDGHQLLAQELREWQAPCSGAATAGPLPPMAPTRTFNRENPRR